MEGIPKGSFGDSMASAFMCCDFLRLYLGMLSRELNRREQDTSDQANKHQDDESRPESGMPIDGLAQF
jgi:hypothetical protein